MSTVRRRAVPLPSEEVQERFWEKVEIGDECWLWMAAKRESDGIGVFGIDKVIYYAHRVAYVVTRGPIPDDKDVRRLCNNPLCVRPLHLFLADPREPPMPHIGQSEWVL